MTKHSDSEKKKDSSLLKDILQIVSFLVIPGYIALYFFDLMDRETVSLDFFFYKHLFFIVLLVAGLILSFNNAQIAGYAYLFFVANVAATIFITDYELANVSTLILDIVMSIVCTILGILFIVTRLIDRRSKWD